jgi:hypothetical protein
MFVGRVAGDLFFVSFFCAESDSGVMQIPTQSTNAKRETRSCVLYVIPIIQKVFQPKLLIKELRRYFDYGNGLIPG